MLAPNRSLSVALLCGLVGFVLHTMWVVSIVVLALGYVVANTRQDRKEVTERREEDSERTE